MKKRLSPLAVISALIALLLLFSACGGSSSGSYKAYGAASSSAALAAPAAPMASPMEYAEMDMATVEEAGGIVSNTSLSGDFQTGDMPSQRKIVKHTDLELETKEFETAISQILQTVEQNGGYIESQNVNGQSLRYNDSYYERYAYINARVPSDKLDAVAQAIGGMCNVTSRNESIDDITDNYYDVDAHLKSLKLQEERLLDILSKAEKLDDVISLEQALSEVRYQIESLTSTLRRMDSQVQYSYLNMSVREVVEYRDVNTAPKTFGEKLAASFARSGRNLYDFFEGALFFIIEELPLLLIWIAIIAVVVFIAIKFIRAFKRKVNLPLKKFGKSKTDDNANKG